MDRIFVPTYAPPPRRALHTVLRALFCLLLVPAFLAGTSSLSIGGPAIMAVATLLSLFLAHELTIRDAPAGWLLAAVLFPLMAGGLGYGVWRITRPPEPVGPLLPAQEPAPPPVCGAARSDLVMAFGPNRVIGKGKGPFKVLTVDDCMVLSLRRQAGGLMIRAFFYDWNNDIAFRVMDNIYEPATSLQLRPFRPDPHSFVLLDRFDGEVLYVRYLNPDAVRIRGRFLCGEQPQAVIHDDEVLVGGIRINGVFVGQRRSRSHACIAVDARTPEGLVLTGR